MATGSKNDAKSDATKSGGTGIFDSELADTVKESAQQIWLAGMGAFAKAQAEGKSVFEALVKEGTSLQKKTQGLAETHFGDVAVKMGSVAGEVQAKAGQQWGKLESIFEERTAKALQKLGVPSSKDMQAMQDRIDALTTQLASERQSSGARSTSTKAPAKKAARKVAAAKNRSVTSTSTLSSSPVVTSGPTTRRRPAGAPAAVKVKPVVKRATKRVA